MDKALSNKGLNVAHLNICSLRNKIHDIAELLENYNLNILAISETHLDETINNSLLHINGYSLYRHDRNLYGGGVAFYVQDQLPVRIREDLGCIGVEALWLEVQLPHIRPIMIGCCYRPPNAPIVCLDRICYMLDRACDLNREIFFLGDLNIDWGSENCPLKSKLESIAVTCNLAQVVTKPTRISYRFDGTRSATCIDLLFTNSKHLCSKAISVCVGVSDHNLIAVNRKTKVPKVGQKIVIKRIFKYFNEEIYRADIANIDWTQVLCEEDPDEALELFMNLIMPIIDNHAPLKRMTVRSVVSPWVDNELKEYFTQRDVLKAEAISSGDVILWDRYKKLRNYVTKLNRLKKRAYYENKFKDIKSNTSKTWNTLNELTKRISKPVPSFLEVDNLFLTKSVDIANYLGDYYKSKVQTLRKNMNSKTTTDLGCSTIKNNIMENKYCTFAFDKVSISTIESVLKSMKVKPSGMDELDIRLLKLVADIVAIPVSHIINISLEKCRYPVKWKVAKIVPLPKNTKEPFSAKNSRPISILPALSKVMEKIVYEQINFYFCNNGLHSPSQHAYKKGHSTTTALTQMTDDWLNDIENKRLVGTVLLDLSAAFDLLDHNLLLEKLSLYGFQNTALQWINSYLSNREFKVAFNGSYSEIISLSCGVPQGSCLGPLLFSIFTNELPFILKSATIVLYADDSTIYVSAHNSVQLNTILNKELKLVELWISENKLVINTEKTKSLMIGSSYLLKNSPVLNLSVGGATIEQVAEAKLLGLTVDNMLTWNNQIKNILNKMGKYMAMVRHCKKCIPHSIRKMLVESIVLCHIDYCSSIWSTTTETNLNKLQVAQNKAARLVLNCSFRTSVNDMHNCLAWMHVKNRINYSLIKFIRNIITKKIPEILFNKLTFFSDVRQYFTRQSDEGRFLLPRCRTNQSQRTVLYRAMVAWNSLPQFLIVQRHATTFCKRLRLFIYTQN